MKVYTSHCIFIRNDFANIEWCGWDRFMQVKTRKATEKDVLEIYELIAGYAEKGIMLPRSKDVISRQLENFYVAEKDGRVVGCGSLCALGSDLVEIRSLGVLESQKGMGIGRMLVECLIREAQKRKFPRVMALTYEVAFFEKIGFSVVPKEIFPEKVWTDCIHCKKQDCCDEVAVLKQLD